MPKDAPAGTSRVWEEHVEGHGTLYFHGAVVRDGERTYLIRRDVTETENSRAVCLLSEDGRIIKWYLSYASSRPSEILRAIGRASDAVIIHSVMSA